jgi:hypothetical protein
MYEVATRQMPQRSLLCLKRNVDVPGLWAFGKEFIAIIRDQRLSRVDGRERAFLTSQPSKTECDFAVPLA